MAVWDTVTIGALLLLCAVGVVLTALRLPGTWLIVAAALAYGWWAEWTSVGPIMVGVLAGLALLGEAGELLLSAATAQRAGATRQAAWGGLAGGILGMLLLSSLLSLPLPVVGTMVGAVTGALVGCFGGAMLTELVIRKKLAHSTKVGLFSALGCALGMAAKIALALVMTGLVLTSVVCSPMPAQRTQTPLTAPAP
jgi:hypothetical protein